MKQVTVSYFARAGRLKPDQAVRLYKADTGMMMQRTVGFLWSMVVRVARVMRRRVLAVMACRLLLLVRAHAHRTSGRAKRGVNHRDGQERHKNACPHFPDPYHSLRTIHSSVETGQHAEKGALWRLLDVQASTGMRTTESFVM